ncbi:hypothetical protein [Providencia rettgeri]|uniref:hypothetical protein n=1 Tax=Providencia rettgeri TaxID=587 RepID=UPI001181C9E1|nr:hypothetical protein [Providencia rettgeri]
MSKFIGNITPGTEYSESLSRFLDQEAKSGHISPEGMRRVTMKRNLAGATALITGMAMVSAGASFMTAGGTMPLLTLIGAASAVMVSLSALARCPGGLFYQVSAIETPFTHDALLRFADCGAPEDVIRELIILLNRQDRVSYAQVHDVSWFCGRQASGVSESHLFHDRYTLIRTRLELKPRRAG